MKEIKIEEDQIISIRELAIDWENGTVDPDSEYIELKDAITLITDHKAVVETMQKRIEELEAELKESKC